MSIENNGEVIYKTLSAFMPCYFRYINPVIHRFISDEYNLHENQIKVIRALDFVGSSTPTELSRYLYIKKGSLTTIIRSLLKLGLITKEAALNDERKYYLNITEQGNAFIKKKNANDIKQFTKIFEKMPDEQVKYIAEGFEKLSRYLLAKTDEKDANEK